MEYDSPLQSFVRRPSGLFQAFSEWGAARKTARKKIFKKGVFLAAPQLIERLKEAKPPCDLVTRVLISRSASLPGLAALIVTMPLATHV